MSTAAKRSKTTRKASAAPRQRSKTTSAAAKPEVVPRARPITVRLAPELKRGLETLHDILKRPVNKLVNDAVEGFIRKRAAEVETDLEGMLSRIKAYRRRDPNFDAAFDRWADAEAGFGGEDPVEGVVLKIETVEAKAGPTQTMVRALLSR